MREIIQRVGDRCPEDHGGGAIVRVDGHVSLEWTEGIEVDHPGYDGDDEANLEMTLFQVGIDDDATSDLEGMIESAAKSCGVELEEALRMAKSSNVCERAYVYEMVAQTWGWHELDHYPTKVTYGELEDRWEGEELGPEAVS